MEVNKSHIPGSLEYLEDDMDPTYKPIDALIYMHVNEQLDFAQFDYKGVKYLVQEDGDYDMPFCLYFRIPSRINSVTHILIHTFPTFLDMLDTPSLHDGATIRQAFSTITGMDTRII